MQLSGYTLDTNFLLVTLFTICLIITTLAYLGALHYMLRGKLWFIPIIILCGFFGYTIYEMDKAFQNPSIGSIDALLVLVCLKTVVILHGVYFLSVLLGKYVGLKKATISLRENEVFIVLISIVAIVIMNNVHTFAWNLNRGILINIVNLVMVYILVNVVFYLGEIKYFFVYSTPILLTYIYFYFAQYKYVSERSFAFSQMQVTLIGTLLVSALYFIIKIRLEFMDDREIARKIEDVKMDSDLKN